MRGSTTIVSKWPLALYIWSCGYLFCESFSTTSLTKDSNGRTLLPTLFAKGAENESPSSSQADFEFQELRIQLGEMQKRGLVSRDLNEETRLGLAAYARKVSQERDSPLTASLASKLPGTEWKLAFSTNSAVLGDLPQGASVLLKFSEEPGQIDYCLEFEKSWALQAITASSTYSVGPPGTEDAGLVTIVYDKITTDIFGLTNVGAGMFGMLQGRSSYIVTSYFDGDYWIERGRLEGGQSNDETSDYLSVYIRQYNPNDAW